MSELRKNYFIFLALAAFFVVAIGAFSYKKFEESKKKGALSQESHLILKQASSLRTAMFKGLIDYKTYQATGRASEREVYRDEDRRFKEALDDMMRESQDRPVQVMRLKKISGDYQKLAAFVQSHGNRKSDIGTVHSLTGKIGEDIDEFLKEEDLIFTFRLNSLIALNRNFYIAIVIGSFMAFALLALMNYYLLLAQYQKASTQKKLEILKERQAQSFQATKDGIFEWKFQDGAQSLYWSPRMTEMIGYTEREVKASAENLEQLMHPDDREGFWHELHRHLRGETSELSGIFRWQHKNGDWIWINARGKASFNEMGDPVKLIGVHTDITRLKEYELQLAKSKNDAEKANSAKSDFLAHMSHEIRTPLTAITGVAEILNMQKAKFDEKTQKLMGALNSSAVGLRDLIGDILDYSKIESGKITLESKEIDLKEFFENIISIVSMRSSEKNLSLVCDYKNLFPAKIMGDKARLRQIIVNLVGNAIKFTVKGGVTIKAENIAKDNRELLRISVADTGIGIPEEEQAHIFDSFKQADESASRKYGGTGLGLPIARNLAKMMGGDINVSSAIGKGSVFTLHIPFIKAGVEDSELSAPAIGKNKLGFAASDRILIVEDYEGNIAFITHIMDESAIKYDLARTGLEGVKLWKENKYALILMDIQMPEMDGIAAVKQIRQLEKESGLHHVPIIAMTAHAFSEDKNKCLRAGFDAYLPKPLTKENLFEAISGLAVKAA